MTAVPDPADQDGSYPRPQLVRRQWCDLGGEWDFGYGVAADDAPATAVLDRRIIVPFPPESPASHVAEPGFHPVLWYRRSFGTAELAAAGFGGAATRLVLHLGAVDWAADVWLNGQHLGRHEGGQTPFSFDVTPALRPDAENELMLRVFDDPHDLAQPRGKQHWRERPHSIWHERTSGIWQPVWLEAVPALCVQELNWATDASHSWVDLELVLSRRPPAGAEARVVLSFQGELVAETRVRVLDRTVRIRLELPRQRGGGSSEELLWWPARPRLLSARIEVEGQQEAGERSCDVVGSYLGVRTVGLADGRFLVNDRPIALRAVLAQNYWPASHLAAPTADALRREVELIKALGFNAARVHQKAEDPRFLYWADRLGLMLWAESASAHEFSDRAVRLLTDEWTRLVVRDRSHPSIVAWVPLNESWGVPDIASDPRQRAYSAALAELTRALDPTRPVVSNDGWEHSASDIWTIHDYEGDPAVLARRYGERAAVERMLAGLGPAGRRMSVAPEGAADLSRPVMLTEFGGVSFGAEQTAGSWGYTEATDAESYASVLRGLFRAAHRSPVLAGFCYTQLTDTASETNGLLYADRSPKLPIEQLRAIVEDTA